MAPSLPIRQLCGEVVDAYVRVSALWSHLGFVGVAYGFDERGGFAVVWLCAS